MPGCRLDSIKDGSTWRVLGFLSYRWAISCDRFEQVLKVNRASLYGSDLATLLADLISLVLNRDPGMDAIKPSPADLIPELILTLARRSVNAIRLLRPGVGRSAGRR